VLYTSIFDLVWDFLKDEAVNHQDRTLRRYLKPDLLLIDDRGLKALPKHSGALSEIGLGFLPSASSLSSLIQLDQSFNAASSDNGFRIL
jgi:hypothetical protein